MRACVVTDQWPSVCDGDPCGLTSGTSAMRHHETDRERRQSGVRLITDDRRTQSVLIHLVELVFEQEKTILRFLRAYLGLIAQFIRNRAR